MQKSSLFLPNTLKLVNKLMGGLDHFKYKKVFTTSIVLDLSNDRLDDLRIIKKVPGCPSPPEDFFLFFFLRAYCRSLLNTGLTLRAEKDVLDDSLPTFMGHKDVENYFYYGENMPQEVKDTDIRPPKPMLVMTKKTIRDDLYTIPFYRCKAYQHQVELTPDLAQALKDEEFQRFTQTYNITVMEDKIVDFLDGLDYLLNKKKYESVLVEAGPSLIGNYLADPNIETPFEIIVLSVLKVNQVKDEWVGNSLPSLKQLFEKHELLYTSPPFPQTDGALTVYVLGKKAK